MAEFYKKTEDGKFVEADTDVDNLMEEQFRQKSDKIVAEKLRKEREKTKAELHKELDEEMRKEISETIKSEAKAEVEAKFKDKLQASEKKAKELDKRLRQKTIAAEYGFEAEMEQFLGDGDDESMRAKADTLKKGFEANKSAPSLEKSSEPSPSSIQSKTGIVVEI